MLEGVVKFPGTHEGHKLAWEFMRSLNGSGWLAGYPFRWGGEDNKANWAVRIAKGGTA